MKPFREDTILLVVANPVDVLTYHAQKFAGLPPKQVFGSGTVLDSARLRGMLAQKHGVAASSISAFVLGEHGDSQVVAWSRVSMGGVPLEQATGGNAEGAGTKEEMAEETKEKASAMIEAKGSTAFGIGGVVASICKSVLYDGHHVLPVSHYHEDFGVCLSTPVVVGRKGLEAWAPIPLDKGEQAALEESAKSLKKVIDSMG